MSKKKSIKGWHNIDRLYVENKSKQTTCIQKSRTECLKGIVYIGCRRKYKAIFLKFVGIVSQSLAETKAKVEVP